MLSADSGLATVGGAAVYGVVRAAQVRCCGVHGPPKGQQWEGEGVVPGPGQHPVRRLAGIPPLPHLPSHPTLPLAAQAEFAEGPPAVHEMRIYALVTRHGGAHASSLASRPVCWPLPRHRTPAK